MVKRKEISRVGVRATTNPTRHEKHFSTCIINLSRIIKLSSKLLPHTKYTSNTQSSGIKIQDIIQRTHIFLIILPIIPQTPECSDPVGFP